MANVAHALTSEARVKARLGITSAGFDTLIKRLIYAATDFIEKECGGRRFKETVYTQQIYDGTPLNDEGTRVPYLILKNAPVASISAFEYRSGSRSSPSWVAFATDDYEPRLTEGLLKVHGGVPAGTQNIRISYTAGYKIDFANEFNDSNHTLPYELSDLCERLVVKRFKKREKEGVSQESFAETTLAWKELLEEQDKATIAQYTRVQFV